MGIVYKNIIQSKFLETTETTQYSVPKLTKCTIDKLTLTNSTLNKAIVTIYLVPVNSFFGANNILSKNIDVYPSQTVSVNDAIGHVLEPEGSIVAVCNLASTITIRSSGREISQ